jgi:hypothetical protein
MAPGTNQKQRGKSFFRKHQTKLFKVSEKEINEAKII